MQYNDVLLGNIPNFALFRLAIPSGKFILSIEPTDRQCSLMHRPPFRIRRQNKASIVGCVPVSHNHNNQP